MNDKQRCDQRLTIERNSVPSFTWSASIISLIMCIIHPWSMTSDSLQVGEGLNRHFGEMNGILNEEGKLSDWSPNHLLLTEGFCLNLFNIRFGPCFWIVRDVKSDSTGHFVKDASVDWPKTSVQKMGHSALPWIQVLKTYTNHYLWAFTALKWSFCLFYKSREIFRAFDSDLGLIERAAFWLLIWPANNRHFWEDSGGRSRIPAWGIVWKSSGLHRGSRTGALNPLKSRDYPRTNWSVPGLFKSRYAQRLKNSSLVSFLTNMQRMSSRLCNQKSIVPVYR
jgi:hypothetical protein